MTAHQSPLTAYKVSFEFFPPKTDEQRDQLHRTVEKLKAHSPEFVSVTFGAGGSTLSYTPETVRELRQAHGLNGVPHLSCMGGSREEISNLLQLYKALGCDRLVALRGDMPSGMARSGDFRFVRRSGALHPRGTRRSFPYRSGGLSRDASTGRRCPG